MLSFPYHFDSILCGFDIAWRSVFFFKLVLNGQQWVSGNAYLLLVGFLWFALLKFGLGWNARDWFFSCLPIVFETHIFLNGRLCVSGWWALAFGFLFFSSFASYCYFLTLNFEFSFGLLCFFLRLGFFIVNSFFWVSFKLFLALDLDGLQMTARLV